MAEKPNLYQRINAIRDEVTTVAKDAEIDGKYRAVTHDAVTRMVRPLMVKHGVISTISAEPAERADMDVKYGKRKLYQYRGGFTCTLINADNPEERLETRVEADADDSGDKAPGKALSYAMKSFYLKAFAVETGEDDEERIDSDKLSTPVETLTEEQSLDLYAKAQDYFGDDADNVLAGLADKIFKVDTYLKIESKHYSTALAWLDAKHKKAQ